MAGKAPGKRVSQKDKDRNGVKDDLDLRDEILDLKREIANLRKEKDKLIIRLRKSEDDSKRKDKQIEQLMDPTQNSEIRRLLSMKGAALLLNLKEQNNTLVQMLTEKNQQIKRLVSEIKTAKLYSKTNRTEPYRLEISRLRTLLLHSQEALKEAAHGPHLNSACMTSHSCSSSDELNHSSQELEDLRFMVQSLETHMRYSKDLLDQKNQEINILNCEIQNMAGGRCCNKISSPHWRIGNCSSRVLNNGETRRCKSALETFQKASPNQTFPDTTQLTRDKIARTQKIPNCPKTLNQVASEDLIRTEKELVELEAKVLSENLKRNVKKDKEALLGTVTGKPKSRNCDRKKTSAGKEKWKCAVQKVRSSEENKESDSLSVKKSDNKVHTNPNANDEEVWSLLKAGIQKKSLSVDHSTPKPMIRKLSLPVDLPNKSIKTPSKFDETQLPVNRENTKLEEPSEIITELEVTPRNETDQKSNGKLPIYRTSFDSSIDSENSSKFEARLFEVEVEINGLASISSLSLSPVQINKIEDSSREKTGGENNFGVGNMFCFENEDDDDDDDDDVITV